jgi:hypothetical protein
VKEGKGSDRLGQAAKHALKSNDLHGLHGQVSDEEIFEGQLCSLYGLFIGSSTTGR